MNFAARLILLARASFTTKTTKISLVYDPFNSHKNEIYILLKYTDF